METITIVLCCWLLTYFLHSTAFYGLAKLLSQTSVFAHTRAREILWKVALCAGVLTASIQVFTGAGVFTSAFESSSQPLPAAAVVSEAKNNAPIVENIDQSNAAQKASPAPLATTIDQQEDLGADATTEDSLTLPEWGQAYFIAFFIWLSVSFVLVIRLFTQKHFFLKSILPREKVTDETLLYTLFKLCNSGGIDQKIVLTSSESLCSPLAMNRGEICLPARSFTELSPEQQQSMLAHELAHVVRRDDLWLKWSNFLETVLFFQPLNRLMRIELQEVTEQRCDEWAIRSTGNAKPLADCLVKVAEWITEPTSLRFASGMALHQSSLRQRIMNILKNQYFNQKELSRLKIVFSLTLIFIVAIILFPGKTWLSVSFAHDSKFASIFNRQEISFGNENDAEAAAEVVEVMDIPDFEVEVHEEMPEIYEMPEMPEMPETPALAGIEMLTARMRSGDTLRFGKDFMLITKGNGSFEVYKNDKLVEKEDYEKYKDDFVVKNGSNIEILAKNGVKVSTGKEEDTPTSWGWSGQNMALSPMPPLPAMEALSSWSNAYSRSHGNGFSYGFFANDDDYTYAWEEDGKDIEVEFDKDDKVKRLEIDGEEIDKADFAKHQKLIDKAKENIKKAREESAKYKLEMREYEDKMREYERTMQKIGLADEKMMQEREQSMRKVERQMEEVQRKQERIMEEQERKMEEVQRKQERIMEEQERKMEEVQRIHEQNARKMEARARVMEKKAQENADKILDELVKDGLIKSKKGTYEMRLNKRGLFIDDEKQSDALFAKYKKLIEDLTGNKIENDNSFMINNN